VDSISEKLTALEEELIQAKNEDGQDPLNFPPMIDNQYVYLYGHVAFAYGRPTEGSYERFNDLNARLQPHLDQLQQIIDTDVAAFNQELKDKGVTVVMVPKY
jgi:hypothetical protein